MAAPDCYNGNPYKGSGDKESPLVKYFIDLAVPIFLVLIAFVICGALVSLTRDEVEKCLKSKCPVDMTPQLDHGVCRCYVMPIPPSRE